MQSGAPGGSWACGRSPPGFRIRRARPVSRASVLGSRPCAPARATAPCCYWLPSPDLLACVKERGEEFNQHLEIICSSTRQSCDASFLQCSLASWLGKRGLAVARTWLTVAAGG